jgi:hypothetical protein
VNPQLTKFVFWCLLVGCILLLISDRMRNPPPQSDSLPHRILNDVLGDAQQLKSTETQATCRDEGGSPYFVGAQFVGCYTCKPSMTGELCTRQ